MRTPATPATRLHVLLARGAPTGVIFRRGPSKQVLLIRWNTEEDSFVTGQWFKGRIYERRCDLSPDGSRLIYFAAKWTGPLQTWTAISRPPFLSALALWPKGDAWNGGGRFLTSHDIVLNHPPGEAELHPEFRQRPVRVVGHAERRGEDDTVSHPLRERDGWEFVARGTWREVRSKSGLHWEADPPEIWRKPHPRANLTLEMAETSVGKKNVGWYGTEYRLHFGPVGGEDRPFGRLDWADWDQRGDLVYGEAGRLFRCEVKRGKVGAPRLLADFTGLRFEGVEAPDWAKHW